MTDAERAAKVWADIGNHIWEGIRREPDVPTYIASALQAARREALEEAAAAIQMMAKYHEEKAKWPSLIKEASDFEQVEELRQLNAQSAADLNRAVAAIRALKEKP
jgi:hypothetical protein